MAGGLDVQRQAVELAKRLGTRLLLGQAQGWLGAILLMAGRTEEAAVAATEGLAVAEAEGAQFDGALCTRVLGETAVAVGDAGHANRLLADALERYARIGHRPEMVRSHASLARCAPTAAERAAHRQMADALCEAIGMSSSVGAE